MYPNSRRTSLAYGNDDSPKQGKTLRKKKIVQLTPQQVRQLQSTGQQGLQSQENQPPTSPRAAITSQLTHRAAESNDDGADQQQNEEENKEQQEPQDQQEHPQVNFNIFPYYHDVVKIHTLLKSSNTKDQVKGALEIGEVAWNGGELAQTFIGKCGVLKTLASLLDNAADNATLKLKIIQSLGIVCRGNTEIQEQLVDLNIINKVYSHMCDPNQEMRKWATHTLFYLLTDCEIAHDAALKIIDLKWRLESIQKDDWSTWDYNDAKEILRMLRLRITEDD